MARLGVLKPLRGTESSLANVVLEDGEVAFSYPTTGPGTGLGGIKMGDGVKTFSNLPWYITGEGSGPDPGWTYDTGTGEAALLHNIEHCERETIGKIYYIQSYCNSLESSSLNIDTDYPNNTTIQSDVPYMVIGVNHDNTTNTVDLMAKCAVAFRYWNKSYSPYNSSNVQYNSTNCLFYTWLHSTCLNGYSTSIRVKMVDMIEKFKRATSSTTGTLDSITTKCKLLNPRELFGSAILQYPTSYMTGTTQDITDSYGTIYEAFPEDGSVTESRVIYQNRSMTTRAPFMHHTNSWMGVDDGDRCAMVQYGNDGAFRDYNVYHLRHCRPIAPVIRLCNNP